MYFTIFQLCYNCHIYVYVYYLYVNLYSLRIHLMILMVYFTLYIFLIVLKNNYLNLFIKYKRSN